ncbi:MAG TPA: ABC transporter substrate-binding protein [Desulfobulbaceae bacterium]|nr:ABC transporter substrate-binding protein [Desulfobulbaceae bacterium]
MSIFQTLRCPALVLLLCLFCAPLAASTSEPVPQLQIFVSILPEEFLAARVGGNRVQVETLVQSGHNPHTYAPTPRQMARLAKAQIYFRIGVPFEAPLIAKLQRTVPDLKIVDLQEGIDLLPLAESGEEHHDHAGELDPHTWLDPNLALAQAQRMHSTLVTLDPEGREDYDRNLARLTDDLHEIDRTVRTILQPLAGQTIYVFHPSYGYFCKAYNLKQKAINVLGKETGAQHLARLIEEAKRDKVRVIFVQPQFSEKTAEAIARSIGGRVVALDPLSRDYLANLKTIALQIAAAQPAPPK